MSAVFLKIVNMSIAAGWAILAVLLLRLLLKKAPKGIICLLWAVAALRLICPFSLESVLSLIPSAETVPADIEMMGQPAVNTGLDVINDAVNPLISGSLAPEPYASANPLQVLIPVFGGIWLAGVAVMLGYALISYLKLRKTVSASLPAEEGVMLCDEIPSPFILGIFRPRIYLPSSLEEPAKTHVLAHERAHLKRRDQLWKPLGFLLLSVYWFNPLCWIAYVLLCRDIEAACDENVIRDMNEEAMAAYSQALLDCSFSCRRIAACPLAFGETGVKERVKHVLNYKKPAFWIILLAVIACVIAAVCFLTDPKKKDPGTDPSDPSETSETHRIFRAVVTEKEGSQILVKALVGMAELGRSDKFEVPVKELGFEPAFGDLLEIDYNSVIQEGYPARLEKIWSVRRVGEEETAPALTEGIYVTWAPKGELGEGYMVRPFVQFDAALNWWAGNDTGMSYGVSGKAVQKGSLIEARQKRVINGPVDEEISFEFRILSQYELVVTRVSGEMLSNLLLREGDVLTRKEVFDTDIKDYEKVTPSGFTIDYGTSSLYTKEDMNAAILVIVKEFFGLSGCELHSFAYTSDERCLQDLSQALSWASGQGLGIDYTQCIVFKGSFHSPVDPEKAGAWNYDQEYTGYGWWLVRKDGSEWVLAASGY